MLVRVFKAGEGAFVVYVKHARVLKLRSAMKTCKGKQGVAEFVQGQLDLEAAQPSRLGQTTFGHVVV